MSLVLCTAEFATGRGDASESIAATIGTFPAARVLERTEEVTRTSLRFTVDSSVAAETAFAALAVARERIDLRALGGTRRPLGATELFAFVPLSESTLEGCTALAHGLGRRVGSELEIPVFFFGAAALRPERRDLDQRCRASDDPRGALGASDVERERDEGPFSEGHPTAGATLIGARRFEVVFEVSLLTHDTDVTREIACRLNETEGGLPGVDARASGSVGGSAHVRLRMRDASQVGLVRAYEEIERLARERGIEVAESRIVGLAPRSALPPGTAERTRLAGFDPSVQILEEQLER